jgi:hypothetical protein
MVYIPATLIALYFVSPNIFLVAATTYLALYAFESKAIEKSFTDIVYLVSDTIPAKGAIFNYIYNSSVECLNSFKNFLTFFPFFQR